MRLPIKNVQFWALVRYALAECYRQRDGRDNRLSGDRPVGKRQIDETASGCRPVL